MINKRKNPVVTGDFISTISPEYNNAFAIELCRILSILVAIDYVLYKYSSLSLAIIIKTGTDCQSVIDII